MPPNVRALFHSSTIQMTAGPDIGMKDERGRGPRESESSRNENMSERKEIDKKRCEAKGREGGESTAEYFPS
jgi:hypothetical protein